MSKFSNCSRTDTNRSVFLPSREAVSRTGESRTIPCFAELFWLPWGRLLFLFHKLIRAERAAPRFRILVLHTASTLTKVLSFIYRGHSWGSHYLFALESKLLFSRPFCLHGVENGWLWSPRGTLSPRWMLCCFWNRVDFDYFPRGLLVFSSFGLENIRSWIQCLISTLFLFFKLSIWYNLFDQSCRFLKFEEKTARIC